MLIQFSVGNYRSFKDVVTLSMLAANITAKDKELDTQNVFNRGDLKLLKSAAIYGANASGKSNLLQAFRFMKWFVLNSSRESLSNDPIEVERFRLSTQTQDKPSFFEIIFFLDDKRYRYGFEVDETKVHSEWLYHTNVRETNLFTRENGKITVSRMFKEGRGLAERTRDNALFLSVADQWNGPISQSISDWFKKMRIISGLNDDLYWLFTTSQIAEGNKLGEDIIAFIKQLDLDILDLKVERVELLEENLPNSISPTLKTVIAKAASPGAAVITLHKKYNEEMKQIAVEEFNLGQESEGTQKLFSLAGPLLDSLQNGELLIVDELDARLHPLVTYSIIQLFNSTVTNPRNVQLIFATHDTNLLSNKLFRRDQIWFTEKDRYEATELYSLAEYKVRNDASFERDYISGRYGAIPFLGDVKYLLGDPNAQET